MPTPPANPKAAEPPVLHEPELWMDFQVYRAEHDSLRYEVYVPSSAVPLFAGWCSSAVSLHDHLMKALAGVRDYYQHRTPDRPDRRR